MILCVSPSPAWDVTQHLDRLVVHGTNRVRSTSARAGGKAVNVARVLHGLGEDVVVLTTAGGATGELLVADLEAAGIVAVAVPGPVETRRTLTLVSDETGDATVVNEAATITAWPAFLAAVEPWLDRADVVVMSGSQPAGMPDDGFAAVVLEARRRGPAVVVDTSGPALTHAVAAGPTLVTPNRDELSEVAHSAADLAGSHATAVAATLGADGILLLAEGRSRHARLPRPLHGNPTGAGDAAVAGFARALARGDGWDAALVDAVALSAAAVLAPCAGDVDPVHTTLRGEVLLEVGEPAR